MEKETYSIYIDGGYNDHYAIPEHIANAKKGKRNVLVLITGCTKKYAALTVTDYNKNKRDFSTWFGDGIKFHYCPDSKIIWK